MAFDPTTSPFYRTTNSRVGDTQPVSSPQDLLALLRSTPILPDPSDDPMDDAIDLPPDGWEEVAEEEAAVSDADMQAIAGGFPIPEAEVTYDDDALAMEPDLSALAPAIQDLQKALRPVDINELRRMVEAGTVGNANTDPYGVRLRETIRQLVRGV